MLIAGLCCEPFGHAADFFASVGSDVEFDSNVYTDQNKEEDAVIRPRGTIGVDLGDFWTLGYEGNAAVYATHPDLFFHNHEAYVFASPAWGENGENELSAELSFFTQRNADDYQSLDLAKPGLFLQLLMEPRQWVRWRLSEDLFYRWFYAGNQTSSLDSWTRASITFTTPSRTTITPKLAFGNRAYFNWGPSSDQQLEAGIRLSQGVVEWLGMFAEWIYHHSFGDSTVVSKSMGLPTFNYIGEEFLYTGHTTLIGLKSVFDTGLSFGMETAYAYKNYGGWMVLDTEGTATGEQRIDHELNPSTWLRYTHFPSEKASRAVPELSVTLSYSYLRQWSTDTWYDTDRHLASVSIKLFW